MGYLELAKLLLEELTPEDFKKILITLSYRTMCMISLCLYFRGESGCFQLIVNEMGSRLNMTLPGYFRLLHSLNIDRLILEESMSKPNSFNGIFLLGYEDEIIHEKVFSQRGYLHKKSQFAIASLSKQFTAVIMLRLVDQNLLDLEMPIIKYLPEAKFEGAEIITVKQLLSHTSGLQSEGLTPAFAPGSKFIYSATFTYALCEQIAERVSKKTFKELVAELKQESKMRSLECIESSSFAQEQKKHPHLATAFKLGDSQRDSQGDSQPVKIENLGEGGRLYNASWNAGAGMLSTARSLLQWNHALHSGKLLSEKSYSLMTTSLAERIHPRYGKVGYGLDIQIAPLEFSHSGFLDGYTSTLLYYPETKISIITLENVSRNPKNISAAYATQDKIRDRVRSNSMLSEKSPFDEVG